MEGVISAIEASVNGGVGAQDASAAYSACEKVCPLKSIPEYNIYLRVTTIFYRSLVPSSLTYTKRTSCCPPG